MFGDLLDIHSANLLEFPGLERISSKQRSYPTPSSSLA